jgi:hypothetical protein
MYISTLSIYISFFLYFRVVGEAASLILMLLGSRGEWLCSYVWSLEFGMG